MDYLQLPEGYEPPSMDANIDGNAFSIVGNTKRALKDAGHEEIAERLMEVAFKGDYDTLLAVCASCVNFEFASDEDEGESDDEDEG
jgi:hypothetical protein